MENSLSGAIEILEKLRKEVEAEEWEYRPMQRAHLSGIRKAIQALSKARDETPSE